MKCTYIKYRKLIDEYMIQCKQCDKYTHFACTRLPAAQLQRFMTKGYKRYNCDNCFGTVYEDYTNNCFEREWSSREQELLLEIEELKKSFSLVNEENSKLRDQLQDVSEDNKNYIERIKSLEDEHEISETSTRALREELSVKNPKIDALHAENKSHSATIARLNEEIVNQQETFDQAGNPDFDNLKNLQQHTKKEISDLGESIKEFLVKEIQETIR